MTTTITSSSRSNDGASAMEAVLQQTSHQFLLAQLRYSSAPLARNMLHKIGLDETAATPFTLVDLGCGMGVVAPLLNKMVPPEVMGRRGRSKVICADSSEALVKSVRRRIVEEGWVGAEARVVDVQENGLETGSISHVVSNIVYHTFTDSGSALQDSIRILAPGGTLAFTTWHALNGGAFPPIRSAFSSPKHFLPDLLGPSLTIPFPSQTSSWGRWGDVDWIGQTLEGPRCRLEKVHVEVLAHTWPIEGPEHYAKAFGAIVDVMAKRVLGDESIAQLGRLQGVRARVRTFLKEEDEYGKGGKVWTLTWVSIVAWGRKGSGPHARRRDLAVAGGL